MKVSEFLKQFEHVPEDLELWISDGYEGTDYHGKFAVKVMEGVDNHKYVEVEVGGLLVD